MVEKLQALIRSKEQLLHNISHELRSPIARLQIALELAKNKTNDLAKDELSRIELEILRLNELIGEILSLAKLSSQTRELTITQFDLCHLVCDVVHDANFESRSEQVQFNPRNKCLIIADHTLIKRAIENIVRNALRYSPVASNINIAIKRNKQDYEIQISDHGPGVPTDDLKKIFTPFYRVDHSREKQSGGYGLGLAIANEAIALHQGTITAKNRQEDGLMVKVRLPKMRPLDE